MLSATTAKVQYVLSSAAQVLAVPFYFLEASHVKVVRTRGDVDTELSGGFTLTGAGVVSGGTLTLTGSQTALGDRITIKRSVPLLQLVSYAPNDRFPASTHEGALDKLTMMMQHLSETVGRSLVYGEGELIASGNVLPGITDRARKVLGFDAHGELDLTVSLEDLRTLVIANPVAALTDVTDYGSIADAVTDVADYGSIA